MRRLSTPISRSRANKSERGWYFGIILLFVLSSIIIAIIPMNSGNTTIPIVDPDERGDFKIPDFIASGVNPNLTREGYPVTLSTKAPGAIPMFDPAGRGSTSLWGLHVDQMRLCYYGTDNLWHETSFQINEVGYRWVADGDA